jgi:hypothetical protein
MVGTRQVVDVNTKETMAPRALLISAMAAFMPVTKRCMGHGHCSLFVLTRFQKQAVDEEPKARVLAQVQSVSLLERNGQVGDDVSVNFENGYPDPDFALPLQRFDHSEQAPNRAKHEPFVLEGRPWGPEHCVCFARPRWSEREQSRREALK